MVSDFFNQEDQKYKLADALRNSQTHFEFVFGPTGQTSCSLGKGEEGVPPVKGGGSGRFLVPKSPKYLPGNSTHDKRLRQLQRGNFFAKWPAIAADSRNAQCREEEQ